MGSGAYCSFVSQAVERSFKLMEPYLEALEREITLAARMVQDTGLRIKSFYMGGVHAPEAAVHPGAKMSL